MPLSPLPLRRSDPRVKRLLSATFPDYRGRKISAIVADDRPLYFDLHWSGGSRDDLRLVDPDGRVAKGSSPWYAPGDGAVVVPPGMILAVHSHFCGVDVGVAFYIRPAAGAALDAGPLALGAGGAA